MMHLGSFAAATVSVLALSSAAPRLPGDLDPSFGSSGRVLISVGAYGAVPTASAVQPDGKIVLAGYTLPEPETYPRCLMYDRRLERHLDPAESTRGGSDVDFIAVRMNQDGTLDSSFGSNGVVRTPINLVTNGEDCPLAVAITPNGRIILAGYATASTDPPDWAFVRYLSSGALDTSFSGDGIQVLPVGTVPWGAHGARAVSIQADGRIVAAGSAFPAWTVLRLLDDGTPDESFGTNGIVQTPLGDEVRGDTADALAIRADRRILVGGTVDASGVESDFAAVQYLSNGVLDATFGDGGIAILRSPRGDFLRDLRLLPSGAFAVAGYDQSYDPGESRLKVARFSPDGTPVWVAITVFGYHDARGEGLVAQADGKLVVGGVDYDPAGSRFALARYQDNGELDPSFGDRGTRTYDVEPGLGDTGLTVLLQCLNDGPRERIIEAGSSSSYGWSYVSAIGVEATVPPGPPCPPPPPAPPPPTPPPPPAPPPPAPPPAPARHCRVPRVIGMTLLRARAQLRRRHCGVGRVRRVASRRVGRVVAQNPRAGTVKPAGFRVRLVVGRR